jgi:hypothetical protein
MELDKAKLAELQKRNSWSATDRYASQLANLAELTAKQITQEESAGNFDEAANLRGDLSAQVQEFGQYVQSNRPGTNQGAPPPGAGAPNDLGETLRQLGATEEMLDAIEADLGADIAPETLIEVVKQRVAASKAKPTGKK